MVLIICQLTPPHVPPAVPGGEILSPRILRQLWGLTARCERAMRMIAPHWQAQKARWGEASCLFEDLACPANLLSQSATIMSEGEGAKSVPEPVIQLLASSVATFLKAAKAAGIGVDFVLPCNFVNVAAAWQPAARVSPAAISLLIPRMAAASRQQGAQSTLLGAARALDAISLLPRMAGVSSQQGASPTLLDASRALDATLGLSQHRDPELCPLMVLGSCHTATLVSKMLAELLHCSGPATTRFDAHYAVGTLSSYAAYLSTEIAFSAGQGCEGAPSCSAQLRDLLTRPLLHLLHSPLLDTLVALQHIMVKKTPLQQFWESTAGASIVCQRRLTSIEPDTMDSRTAMMVGHTLTMMVGHTYDYDGGSHL